MYSCFKKEKPFIEEKKFFEHYGFEVVDSIADYKLLALNLMMLKHLNLM